MIKERILRVDKGAVELSRLLPGVGYFRMSVIQFDMLLAVPQPHVKKNHQFPKIS